MKKVEIIKNVRTHIENGVEIIDTVGVVTGITKSCLSGKEIEIGDYINGATIKDQKFLARIRDFMAEATKTTSSVDYGIFGSMTACYYE